MEQLTLILAFLVTSNAWAAEWTRIGEVKIQGGSFTVYADAATISRNVRIAAL